MPVRLLQPVPGDRHRAGLPEGAAQERPGLRPGEARAVLQSSASRKVLPADEMLRVEEGSALGRDPPDPVLAAVNACGGRGQQHRLLP